MRRATTGSSKSKVPANEKSVVRPRSSLGFGGRLSNPAPRTSGARPKTSFGSSTRRSSSQYGRETKSTQIKDTRPLGDKSYIQAEIRDILQFLSENNYEHPISMKTMMVPTSKEFFRVFSFLYSRLSPDATYKTLMDKKPEEEVPKIFKELGYPFTIHKRLLSNVGSPHAWPVLLGALHWMLDIVKFAMDVSDQVEQCLFPASQVEGGDDCDLASMNKIYYDYCEKSYEAFIDGHVDLENLGEYREALVEELRSRSAPMVAEVGQLSQENLQLEAELAKLQSEPSRLEALTKNHQSLEEDKSKFEAYLDELRRHQLKLEERLRQSEETLNIAKLEHEATSVEKMKLEKILANQELSAADAQRMKQETQELKKTLAKLEELGDAMDQEIWEKEMNYARRHEQVVAQCQDYNARARSLKLIPSSAENAAGVDYELKCHLGRMTLDLNELRPSLLRFKQQLADSCCETESQLMNLQEKHDYNQEQISEKAEEIEMFKAKFASTEKEIQWKKQQFDEQQSKCSAELEEMQNKIDKLRLESQTEKSQFLEKRRQLDETKERIKKRTAEINYEESQQKLFLRKANELVINHKTVIQNRIAEIKNDMGEFHEFVIDLPPVTSELLTKEEINKILEEDEGVDENFENEPTEVESSEKENFLQDENVEPDVVGSIPKDEKPELKMVVEETSN